ncbi:MAG: peptidoglycan DD-metalloendopeptidase family protein [Sneathiella sp.]|nr:peptidoglycan DD-metalloendopeptidase family protein [Sneathiella sp.]
MKLKPVLDRIFVDRQVIISTRGQPKYFKVSKNAQIGLIAGSVCAVSLMVALIVQNSIQRDQLTKQGTQLTLLQDKVRTVTASLLLSKSTLSLTKTELDQQYARLEEILSERHNLKETLQTATADLKQKDSALDNRDQYARDLEDRIHMLSRKLTLTNSRSENLALEITKINKALYHTTEERDQIAEAKSIAQKRLASLNRELQMFLSSKDDIHNELQETKTRLTEFDQERLQRLEVVDTLKLQVANLRLRIETITTENKNLIERVYAKAEQGIDALKDTITLTGLNPDEILALDNVEGIGGPFHNFSNSKDLLKVEEEYYVDAQRMELSLARWTTLNSIMKNIPLAEPTDSGYVSSSFGMRRDPIKKKKAFHAGLDISGPKNTPVYSTAPGVVIKAGYYSAYGLMVEIDHGQGFKTKYGHLKKTSVKKGQKIDFRTRIGTMGSTGRSTGRHVHYEISYKNKPQNPVKFFKAGNYAFKTAPKKTD